MRLNPQIVEGAQKGGMPPIKKESKRDLTSLRELT